MSSYAPDDYGNPEADPYHPDYRRPGPAPTSGLAVASFVCGVLACVPVVNVLAVAFGIIGMRQTRGGHASGRGLAIAGLILGSLGVGAWLLLGVVTWKSYQILADDLVRAQAVATAFLQDLSDGKIDAALAKVTPEASRDLDRARLTEASKAMKNWGPFNEVSLNGIHPEMNPEMPVAIRRWDFDGSAIFSRASKALSIRLVKDGATYKVDRFECK